MGLLKEPSLLFQATPVGILPANDSVFLPHNALWFLELLRVGWAVYGFLDFFVLVEFIMKMPTQRPKVRPTTRAPIRSRPTAPSAAQSTTPDWMEQILTFLRNQNRVQMTTAAPKTKAPKPRKEGRTGRRRSQRRRNKPTRAPQQPRNGAVRLINGNVAGKDRGRVEIYINGEWGTVCDDLWTSKAAAVVCRQLGYAFVIKAAKRAEFGEGRSLPILLDDVQCTGHEKTLLECPHADIGKHNCSHKEDAGVICSHEDVFWDRTVGWHWMVLLFLNKKEPHCARWTPKGYIVYKTTTSVVNVPLPF